MTDPTDTPSSTRHTRLFELLRQQSLASNPQPEQVTRTPDAIAPTAFEKKADDDDVDAMLQRAQQSFENKTLL
ncbi:MAG: hypothetical protein AAGK67_16560 [Pseudomonadota bacterium]